MRFVSAAGAAICLAQSLAFAATDFPYRSHIVADGVFARSGPGEQYYPTERIAKGDTVEVYSHDPRGWCAIRPLPESTSWVAATDVELRPDGIAVIKRDGTPSRVGTKFRDAQNVVQVRLKRGEAVEVLRTKTIRGRRWLEISPPAGEFRFVEESAVEAPRVTAASEREIERETPGEPPLANTDDPTAKQIVKRQQSKNREIEPAAALETGPEVEPEPGIRWAGADSPSVPSSKSLPRSTSVELADIDLELSAIATEDVESWSLTAVRARAQAALNDAQTALDRGRVRAVISKIERFEEIKRRYDEQHAPATARPTSTNASFDGVGRLAPVASQKPGAPPYALLSPSGEIMSYVTPAAGVNLRPYLNQMVGVTGSSSYVPEARRQHIQAERILPIEMAQRPVVRR